MSKKNDILTGFFSRAQIFAELFNGSLYEGRQVIKPEQLAEIQNFYNEPIQERYGKKKQVERRRDVARALFRENGVVILAVELQDSENYIMPIRCAEYDLLELLKQIRKLKEKYKRNGGLKTKAEFLSGIKEEDRIIPVITLVLNHGKKRWNTHRSIKDMLDLSGMDEELKELILDHEIKVINLVDLDENHFQTGLRELVGLMKRSEDKAQMYAYYQENRMRFEEMDETTFDVICTVLNLKPMLKKKENFREEKGGKLDMCKAFEDLMADCRMEGRTKGVQEGEERLGRLITLLLSDGRTKEVKTAASNVVTRRKLYKEYGL